MHWPVYSASHPETTHVHAGTADSQHLETEAKAYCYTQYSHELFLCSARLLMVFAQILKLAQEVLHKNGALTRD